MASKRRDRRKTCEGKIRHANQGAAWAAVGRTGHDVLPYGCPYCGFWHVGHPPGWARQSYAARRRQR